jgi:hypothetical protein
MLPLEIGEGKVQVTMRVAKKYIYITIKGKVGEITIRTKDKLVDLRRYLNEHGERQPTLQTMTKITAEIDLETLYDLILPDMLSNVRFVRRIRPFFG